MAGRIEHYRSRLEYGVHFRRLRLFLNELTTIMVFISVYSPRFSRLFLKLQRKPKMLSDMMLHLNTRARFLVEKLFADGKQQKKEEKNN